MYNTADLEGNFNRDIPSNIYYMFIDTETTGVPLNNYQDWTNCRLIQLGFVVKNGLFETVREACLTIRLDNTNQTTEEAYRVHGISDESRINATPGKDVCALFMNMAEQCDVLISHGNAFDFGVIFRECLLHDIDISRLIGKTVINTKQSEHYRGFRENLYQTVLRINPNWQFQCELSDYNHMDIHHTHNALYDAYLCAELYRLSHHPLMARPMQDLIEFLNFRRYYADIPDIKQAIANIQPLTDDAMEFNVNERLLDHINMEREMEEQPYDLDENEYKINIQDEETFDETEDDYFILEEEEEEECMEYGDDISVYSESSTLPFNDGCISNEQPSIGTTTEDYLRSFCSGIVHHAPEDWDN